MLLIERKHRSPIDSTNNINNSISSSPNKNNNRSDS